jgi:hypothetical protein
MIKTSADRIAKLEEAVIDALSHLVAATSLLEHGGKKAAPSDKMFQQMLLDYNNSIKRVRNILQQSQQESTPYAGPARDGIEAQRGYNDIFPGDSYPPENKLKARDGIEVQRGLNDVFPGGTYTLLGEVKKMSESDKPLALIPEGLYEASIVSVYLTRSGYGEWTGIKVYIPKIYRHVTAMARGDLSKQWDAVHAANPLLIVRIIHRMSTRHPDRIYTNVLIEEVRHRPQAEDSS